MISLERLVQSCEYDVPHESFLRIINVLTKHKTVDIWTICRETQEYLYFITSILDVMRKQNLIKISEGRISLTNLGKIFVKNSKSKRCQERLKIMKISKFENLIKKLHKKIYPKLKFDQSLSDPKSLMTLISYMVKMGDVENKSIICIGDEDLLSVLLSLTGLPRYVVAVDVDLDIIRLIRQISEEYNLNVQASFYDPRQPIPKNMKKKFDVFITQPPHTVAATSLFVSRGLNFLKNEIGKVGYFGINPIWCPPLGITRIQKNLMKMNVEITDILKRGIACEPSEEDLKYVPTWLLSPVRIPWDFTDVYRIKTTKNTRPFIEEDWKRRIYDYVYDMKKYNL